MASVSATLVDNVKVGNETYVTGSETLSIDDAPIIAQTIPIAATVEAVAIPAFAAADLQFIYLLSDQDITLTVTLGTGSKTIALKAGVPWRWTITYIASIPVPFAYGVVSCTAANASGVAANFVARLGINA